MDPTPALEALDAHATGIAALDVACRLLGSQDRLADTLNIRSPSITGWRDRNRVPAERCREIEAATGGRVSRYQLRPDVFGPTPPTPVREVG